jgi:hypothetical protein
MQLNYNHPNYVSRSLWNQSVLGLFQSKTSTDRYFFSTFSTVTFSQGSNAKKLIRSTLY